MGRDLKGWDCFGLYRYVLQAEFGVVVGSFAEAYTNDGTKGGDQTIHAVLRTGEARGWQRVAEPRPGDGIVFCLGGEPMHCGLIVDPATMTMIHAMRGRGTCLERADSMAWKRRIEGVYRWNK